MLMTCFPFALVEFYPIEHPQVVDISLSGQHPDEGQKSCTQNGKTRQHGTVWAAAAMDSHSLSENQCTECSCTVSS